MNRLRWAMYGCSILVALLIGFSGITFYARLEKEFSKPLLMHHAQVNFEFLKAITVDDLIAADQEKLKSFVEQAIPNKWDVRMVEFKSRDGNVLAKWEDNEWEKISQKLGTSPALDGYYIVRENVEINGENFGEIAVAFDFREVLRQSERHSNRIKLIACCFFVAMGLLTLLPLFSLDIYHLVVRLVKRVIGKFKKAPEEEIAPVAPVAPLPEAPPEVPETKPDAS